jgi:hypothetical protein
LPARALKVEYLMGFMSMITTIDGRTLPDKDPIDQPSTEPEVPGPDIVDP